MTIIPFIDIRTGRAVFITPPKKMESGYNRSDEACTLEADNDWDSIIEFLNEYKGSPKTLRSYTSEMERFISWLCYEKLLPISALKRSHAAEYMEFLKKPDPLLWCGHRANKFKKDGTINKAWMPFSFSKENMCGLSDATTRRSRKILDSYFKYLVDNNYLYGNPLTAKRTKGQRKKKTKNSVERFLELNQIFFILETLNTYEENLEEDNKRAIFMIHRARYIFLLYLHTGMRISEPATYTMGHLENHNGEWKIFVQGKGDEEDEGRDIQLGTELMEALMNFRLSVGLTALPLFEEKTPLIPQENLHQHISERQISNIFRWLFDLAASQQQRIAEEFDPHSNEYPQLKREISIYQSATCHWLRHSHATYFLKVTDDLKATQERLGHADVGTTMIYLHTLNKQKQNQANKFNLSDIQNKSK
ncbi:MAG: tyrosine-type recombinase/integrase [Gammaproteobacteria bacterium]|nr:tyrosine-type recombinase/integrase [Gammaproteobacteria bacterium]